MNTLDTMSGWSCQRAPSGRALVISGQAGMHVKVTTNAFTAIITPDLQQKKSDGNAGRLEPTAANHSNSSRDHASTTSSPSDSHGSCRMTQHKKKYVSVSTAQLFLRCSCWRLSKIAAAAAAASSDRHQHQHHTRDQCRDKAAAAAEVDDGSGDAMMSTEMMTT